MFVRKLKVHRMTKPSLSSVIRMAQAVAEREVKSPSKNATVMKQAIESVLQMIEAKSGNGAEIQKLTSLVRQAICTRPLHEKKT